MRVLFSSTRGAGHFQPLGPLIAACQRGGHEVAVAAPKDIADAVRQAGARFFPFAHPGDEQLESVWARVRDATHEEANIIVVREIFAGLDAAAALPGLSETVESWRPSLIVREVGEFAASVAAAQYDLPEVRVGICLAALEDRATRIAAEPVSALRASVGLSSDPEGEALRSSPYFTQFPKRLEKPDTPDFERIVRFRAPLSPHDDLPDAWWPKAEGSLIYVTFGSVAGGMPAAHALYRAALDAVAELPVRVLLTTGSGPTLDALGPAPANVHLERWVPQESILPQVAALVCHGGSGTVIGGLASGVPLVVVPLFADQPYNAERVAAVGAGVVVADAPPTPDALRTAIEAVLEQEQYGAAARAVAAEMRGHPSADEIVVELETLAAPPSRR